MCDHSAPVSTADAGQCVSFALKRVRRTGVRKGMVIVSKTETPPKGRYKSSFNSPSKTKRFAATRRFEGQVLIL